MEDGNQREHAWAKNIPLLVDLFDGTAEVMKVVRKEGSHLKVPLLDLPGSVVALAYDGMPAFMAIFYLVVLAIDMPDIRTVMGKGPGIARKIAVL
jgi:hypothetical protein